MTSDEIVDNAAMHRFEMAVGEEMAVAYYQEADGRVVLLHTEVPQQLSGQGVGSRLARVVFETLKTRGRRVIAKCPFMSSYAAKHPEYLAILDG
jgi:predicted GNAT family acetyltransferase